MRAARKRIRSLIVTGVLHAALTGFAAAAANPGAEVRVGLIGDIRSTNPGIVGRDSTTDNVLHHVVEGLVGLRDDLTIGPVLAESFSASADDTTFTFKLRRQARFHNGEPLLAKHVKWSLTRLLDPNTNFQCIGYYNGSEVPGIRAIDTPDDHTVVIRLTAPNSLFLAMMAAVQCTPMIVHPSSVDAQGRWIAPVGTGPYQLTEWKRDRYVLLDRSPNYVPRTDPRSGLTGRREPLIERIRWTVINDVAAVQAALNSGQIDLVYSVGANRARQFRTAGKFTIARSPGLSRRVLLMSQRDPLLADTRMRRAIAMAVDPVLVNQVVEAGEATSNPSVVPAISPYYTAVHAQGYPLDLVAARRLIAGAGYAGQILRIKTTKLFPEFYDTAIVVQSQLKTVGLNAQIEVLEWAALLNDYLTDDFQLLPFQFSPRSDAALDYADVLGPKKKYPDLQWDDPDAFALLVRTAAEPRFEARRRDYEELHRRMLQDVPFVNLHDSAVIDIVSSRLQGYAAWPGATPRLWGVKATR